MLCLSEQALPLQRSDVKVEDRVEEPEDDPHISEESPAVLEQLSEQDCASDQEEAGSGQDEDIHPSCQEEDLHPHPSCQEEDLHPSAAGAASNSDSSEGNPGKMPEHTPAGSPRQVFVAPRLPVSTTFEARPEANGLPTTSQGPRPEANGFPTADFFTGTGQGESNMDNYKTSASPIDIASSEDGQDRDPDQDNDARPDGLTGNQDEVTQGSAGNGAQPMPAGNDPGGNAGSLVTRAVNKMNLHTCQSKLLERVRMWGFPTMAEEYVRRWTITRNRSGNYHYQTPLGRRFTSKDQLRDHLADLQKNGKFGPGGLDLVPGRSEVWTNGVKACLSWRCDGPGDELGVVDLNNGHHISYTPVTSAAPRSYCRKALPKWQAGGEAETNLWTTQRKLLEGVIGAGFSQEVVSYVQTWRVVAIGAHEYNYHLPRGLGKVRSMKAVITRLRELQQQDKLLSEAAQVKPGRTICNFDKNGRLSLVWQRADGQEMSPEPANSGGAVEHPHPHPQTPPTAGHVVHRPTAVTAQALWQIPLLGTNKSAPPATHTPGPLNSLPSLPLAVSSTLPSHSPAPTPLANGSLHGLAGQNGVPTAFQHLKRPFTGAALAELAGNGYRPAKRPAGMTPENGLYMRMSPHGGQGHLLGPTSQGMNGGGFLNDPTVVQLLKGLEDHIHNRESHLVGQMHAQADNRASTLSRQLEEQRQEVSRWMRAAQEKDKMINALTHEVRVYQAAYNGGNGAHTSGREVAVSSAVAVPAAAPAAAAAAAVNPPLPDSEPSVQAGGGEGGSPKNSEARVVELLKRKLVETQAEVKTQRDKVAELQAENNMLRDKVLELEVAQLN